MFFLENCSVVNEFPSNNSQLFTNTTEMPVLYVITKCSCTQYLCIWFQWNSGPEEEAWLFWLTLNTTIAAKCSPLVHVAVGRHSMRVAPAWSVGWKWFPLSILLLACILVRPRIGCTAYFSRPSIDNSSLPRHPRQQYLERLSPLEPQNTEYALRKVWSGSGRHMTFCNCHLGLQQWNEAKLDCLWEHPKQELP